MGTLRAFGIDKWSFQKWSPLRQRTQDLEKSGIRYLCLSACPFNASLMLDPTMPASDAITAIMKRRFLKQSRQKITTKKQALVDKEYNKVLIVAYLFLSRTVLFFWRTFLFFGENYKAHLHVFMAVKKT